MKSLVVYNFKEHKIKKIQTQKILIPTKVKKYALLMYESTNKTIANGLAHILCTE